MIVLDASVAVKWYFPEDGSDAAIGLLGKWAGEIVVPELFVVEVCAALVRKANMDRSERDGVLTLLTDFHRTMSEDAVEIRALPGVLPFKASRLAIDLGHPLKDCIYLALAMELGCDLVTADARFAAKAGGTYAGVRVLGE